MSGYIILENLPEEGVQVRIDLSSYQELPEKFMGFRDVPPGLHYVSITTQNQTHSFWHYLRSDQMFVKFFSKFDQEFLDDEYRDQAEATARYQKHLAVRLLKEEQLIPYNYRRSGSWLQLICDIIPSYFPVTLHTSPQGQSPSVPSSPEWEKEVFETHKGDFRSFIVELQFAFVCWYVSDLDSPTPDLEAFNRWKYLVEATCNADLSSLAKAPPLVNVVASTLTLEFDSLDDSLLPFNDPLIAAARRLQEKMLSGEIPRLVSYGLELKTYLDERYQNS
jgi:hypothetical protein